MVAERLCQLPLGIYTLASQLHISNVPPVAIKNDLIDFLLTKQRFLWFDDLQGSAEVEMMMMMRELATLMIQLHVH